MSKSERRTRASTGLLFLLEHFEDIHTIVRWTRDKDAAKMRLMEELGMGEEAAVGIIDAGINDFTYEDLELVRADLARAQRIIRFFHGGKHNE